MQRILGSTLEHEEIDQHSKEDIGGGVDSLEEKQGVQDAKMSKLERSHEKKRSKRWLSGHRPKGGSATKDGLLQLEKRRAPNSTVCTALVTAMGGGAPDRGWRCHRPNYLESSKLGLGHRPGHRPQGGCAPRW
jgi:hypothetical protein